ncbi:bacterial-like transketolase [Cordyceps militaris CM01]|uniref:Bacterial-like transketolase n=1 Tax=Cordyceps militaris (strain CM01) TaxID=983644 RepID=G3J5F1_CORMM|nr:bacterial-like transketolase [Cordyceps militaris CM01]EGX96012.1 bacterial-like transketolase [Cordyceps militaris CM01]
MGIARWRYVLKYSLNNPKYLKGNRFVLSNGHTCQFKDTFLAVYKDMTLSRSSRTTPHAPLAGPPETEIEGIKVTTDPFGQGVAKAVGLAIAMKKLAATYNRPGYNLVNNVTCCITRDICLQVGVCSRGGPLTGYWKLNNLAVPYANHQMTCDVSIDLLRAYGWDVLEAADCCFDVEELVKALLQAEESQESQDKPSVVC